MLCFVLLLVLNYTLKQVLCFPPAACLALPWWGLELHWQRSERGYLEADCVLQSFPLRSHSREHDQHIGRLHDRKLDTPPPSDKSSFKI